MAEGAEMARTFRIQINLRRLRENLSREDRRAVSLREVTDWLERAGFAPSSLGWTVSEADLGQLDPAEVTSAEVVGAAGGKFDDRTSAAGPAVQVCSDRRMLARERM
jgi:hypothetical protein